ncbi:TrmH family RNA methyltransferase [Flavilitoribacter nigricans]|uniref:RNA methyltransferase n=1 Tax=Flavilitoribacter nigricans (strain ATCC 23147 / DSM 23189 / NBRC 102662 / NCIMB 1420 / SS-2) TaxID=1122177 RepID=A0A2D0NHL0_FLAN2|nr:RNA methyltransferase [Flavilitoribacter nigricans]PHN07994.1 RNA methyltransferase [Flavilitoribacter nigricans DSM 23189 = NBRC 102662]
MNISKNKIKYLKSLHRKKFRQKYDNFILEGDKMTRELLDAPDHPISGLYALEEWLSANPKIQQLPPENVFTVTPAELSQISTLTTPNQVLATVQLPHPVFDISWLHTHWTFYLDNIQDPGNMGTILRIADWFGLEWVCGSPGCVEVFNPKVVQASMGAILRVKFAELELSDFTADLKEMPILGASMEGQNIYQARLPSRGLIVIGNEGQGISENVKDFITNYIAIPRHPKGGAESLNAGVSAGIIAALVVGAQLKGPA